MQQNLLQCQLEQHNFAQILGACINEECNKEREFCFKCLKQFHAKHIDDLLEFQELIEWENKQVESFNDWKILTQFVPITVSGIYKLFQPLLTKINPNESLQNLNNTQLKNRIIATIIMKKATQQFGQRINEIKTLLSSLEKDCQIFFNDQMKSPQINQQTREQLLQISPRQTCIISTAGTLNLMQQNICNNLQQIQQLHNGNNLQQIQHQHFGNNVQQIQQQQNDNHSDNEFNILELSPEPLNNYVHPQIFEFSQIYKYQEIEVSNNNKCAKILKDKGLILVDRPIPKTKVQIIFKAKKCSYIHLGIAPKQSLQSIQFKIPEQLKQLGNYGCHLITDYGFSFSPNEQDNFIQQQFKFDNDHLIIVDIDRKNKTIEWFNTSSNTRFNLKMKIDRNQEYFPCVGLSQGATVEIVEDINKFNL